MAPFVIQKFITGKHDARLEQLGWSLPGFNDSKWSKVAEKDFPKENLIGTYNEPIRKHETFKPVKIFRTPKGELWPILDRIWWVGLN